jgi:hypothetical protein
MLNKRLKLICEYCSNKEFKFFDEFVKHQRNCLEKRMDKILFKKCPICSTKFRNYFAWDQHLRIEHFIN